MNNQCSEFLVGGSKSHEATLVELVSREADWCSCKLYSPQRVDSLIDGVSGFLASRHIIASKSNR